MPCSLKLMATYNRLSRVPSLIDFFAESSTVASIDYVLVISWAQAKGSMRYIALKPEGMASVIWQVLFE